MAATSCSMLSLWKLTISVSSAANKQQKQVKDKYFQHRTFSEHGKCYAVKQIKLGIILFYVLL